MSNQDLDELISIIPEQLQEVHLQVIEKTTVRENTTSRRDSLDFKEDFEENFDPNNAKYKSKPHDVVFRCRYHFKYFFIRILFLFVGPFSLLFLFWKKDIMTFMVNIRILGITWQTLYNNVRFIWNIVILIMILNTPFTWRLMSAYLYFGIVNIAEAMIGAIKLAFYHPSKLELFEHVQIMKFNIQGERCINPITWVWQDDDVIEFEIRQSVSRNQIEIGQFFIFFLVEPNEKRKEAIRYMFQLVDGAAPKYAGDAIQMAKQIVQYFNSQSSLSIYATIVCLLVAIRVIVLIVLHIIWPMDFTNTELAIYIMVQIMQNGHKFMTLSIMLVTFRDLQRKVFAMNQMSHLMSCQKLFPTSNLLCVVSLFSWSNLRKVMLDYGLQYQKRTQYMVSFTMACMALQLGFALYLIINPQSLESKQILILQVQLFYDCIVVITIGLITIFQAARINHHFKIHKALLRTNLFIFQQLNLQRYLSRVYDHKPENYVFRVFKQIINDKINKARFTEADFAVYSQFVINSIESVYRDLEYEEEYSPFTVLGIPMTTKLVIQVASSFVAVIITMTYTFYKNHNIF